MNIQEIVEILVRSGIEPNEASKEVKMLIEHFCNYTAKDIILGNPLDYDKLEIVKQKAQLRANTRKPIQYIIGQSYFMGDFYEVNEDVLIPRDETEIVVNHALKIIKNNGFKKVLDIGTGSGCIACAISKYAKVDVCAVDISDSALKIAKKNAKKLGVGVNFINSDLFSNINEKFDLIISNPPYIPKGTKVQRELGYEPQNALFTSEETGCEFYKKIIEDGVDKFLNKNGYIVFEIGINQSELVKQYFENNGFVDIVIENDLANIPRAISAKKKL